MGNAWIVGWTARASLPRKWPLGRRSGMPKRHTSTGRLRWPLLAGNYANFTHQSKIDGILGVRPRITADFQACFDFTGLWPFRPPPSPRRAPLPSTSGGGAGATPNLQEVVRQA